MADVPDTRPVLPVFKFPTLAEINRTLRSTDIGLAIGIMAISFAVVQFAPGTLSRQSTRSSVLLDTDQNASTGLGQPDGLGADYSIDLDASRSQATITKADPVGCAADRPCFNPVGSAPITFVGDAMQVTFPLSLLGNDDGRMGFQANTYVLVAPLTSVVFDFMPDPSVAPGRIQ